MVNWLTAMTIGIPFSLNILPTLSEWHALTKISLMLIWLPYLFNDVFNASDISSLPYLFNDVFNASDISSSLRSHPSPYSKFSSLSVGSKSKVEDYSCFLIYLPWLLICKIFVPSFKTSCRLTDVPIKDLKLNYFFVDFTV